MSDTSEYDPDEDMPAPDPVAQIESKAPKSVGYVMLGLATIFAALAGGIGGAVFSVMTEQPAADLTEVKRELSLAQGENKSLKTQIAKLERDVKTIPVPKSIDLSAIRARLEILESAEAPVIDPDLVTPLESLQNEGSDVMDLSEIYARLEALETRPVKIETPVAAITDIEAAPAIDAPAFPKAEILAALDEQDKSKGWLKRTIDKNIFVQSEDNPRYLVELIEADITAGDIAAALAKFDKLPPQARFVAQDWRKAISS